jgi:hypothetical protein
MITSAVPAVYSHPKCPAWGRGVAFAEHSDRRDVIFEDGTTRTFKYAGWPLVGVDLPAEDAAALGQALLGKKAGAAAKAKSAARKAAAALKAAKAAKL